jgi:hypothetical protein
VGWAHGRIKAPGALERAAHDHDCRTVYRGTNGAYCPWSRRRTPNLGLREYQMHAGNRGVRLLRRTGQARTHFLLLSLWSSRQAIAAYAGADIGRAHYYPYDLECLVDPVPTVEHFEVWSGRGERL